MSQIEELLVLHLKATKLPMPTREHRFHGERGWRFDFAWPDRKIAVECEGGCHRIDGRFQRDIEKYNAAQLDGWVVLRFSPKMIRNGVAIETIEDALR